MMGWSMPKTKDTEANLKPQYRPKKENKYK